MLAKRTGFLCVVLACVLSGCHSIPTEPVTSSTSPFPQSTSGRSSSDWTFSSLEAAMNARPVGRSIGGASPRVMESELVRKTLVAQAAAVGAYQGRSAAPLVPLEIDSDDFKAFVSQDLPKYGPAFWVNFPAVGRSSSGDVDQSFGHRLQQYYAAYAAGKYVDRQGKKLDKPNVTAEGIGNDTLVPTVYIFFEALYDEMFPVPVFYKGNANQRTWFNAGNAEPTFAVMAKNDDGSTYDERWVKDIGSSSDFTELELRAMQFVAMIGADQSKLVSGLLFRLFGDVELGFVIGADFAVGDNETLAKVIDAWAECSSRRLTEAAGYEFFRSRDWSNYEQYVKALLGLLEDVYKKHGDPQSGGVATDARSGGATSATGRSVEMTVAAIVPVGGTYVEDQPAVRIQGDEIKFGPTTDERWGPLERDPRYQSSWKQLFESQFLDSQRLQPRIIGGEPAAREMYENCVALGRSLGADSDRAGVYKWGCTGTLIAADVVLTAGHCWSGQFVDVVYVGTDVDDAPNDPRGIRRVVKRVPHESFNRATLENDLCLLFLESPYEDVTPARLANAVTNDSINTVRIVGFGSTRTDGRGPLDRKMFVDTVVPIQKCSPSDQATYGCFLDSEQVSGKPNLDKDSCNGDSGGPCYVLREYTDERGAYQVQWDIAAVVSRATKNSRRACGDGGINVRVDFYEPWIDKVLRENGKSRPR
jgi:Trypsin